MSMGLLPSLQSVSSGIQVNGKDVLMYPSVAARSDISLLAALNLAVLLCLSLSFSV